MINTDLGNLFSGTAEALWRLGKDKDSAAWSMIVKLHSSGMLHAAKGVLGDHFLAEDAVQNAFLQIRDLSAEYFRRENDKSSVGILGHHQKENTIFNNDFAARNWIIRITYFVAKDMKKSRFASKEREKVFTQNWAEERESRSAPDQEMLAILQNEIEKLPEELRLPLVLRFHCDMNFNQVSSELGLTVHVIRQRVQKGIEVLQTKISAFVGSSMSVVGVESLLNNVFSLNEGVSNSLFKSCADLLDKPALTKSQLIPENKLLLQSSKFMVKGLVMLKILAILAVLVFTAMLVVNSIHSNESSKSTETKEKALVLEKTSKEKISSKKKEEDLNLLNSKEEKSNESMVSNSKQNNSSDTTEIKATNKNETITSTKKEKSEEFDINEILPYFSDKAIFTLIMPNIVKSKVRFNSSSASKFYCDPSVDLFGKISLIMKSQFDIDSSSLSNGMINIVVERALQSFYCIGVQYTEDLENKKSLVFVAAILKKEEEITFDSLLKTIEPFQKQIRKASGGSDIITYQFLEDSPQFLLVKNKNKVYFGSAGGDWVINIEKKSNSNNLINFNLSSDICWKLNANAIFEKWLSKKIEMIQELLRKQWRENCIKYIEDITGELEFQPTKISHKIGITLKSGDLRGNWDILVFKSIMPSMLDEIPKNHEAFACVNLDLEKSWSNLNDLFRNFDKQDNTKEMAAIKEAGIETQKNSYENEFAKYNEIAKSVFQMDINSLMTKCLTGKIICWVNNDSASPILTIRFGVQELEFAKKLGNVFDTFWGKPKGIKFSIDENYITIIMPVPKIFINQNYLYKNNSNQSQELTATNILNKKVILSLSNNFACNSAWSFLVDIISNQGEIVDKSNEQKEKLKFPSLFFDYLQTSSTNIEVEKNSLKIEMEGLDDFIQKAIIFILIEKMNQNNIEIPQYTELSTWGNFYDGKGALKKIEYIYEKGYVVNKIKTGLWSSFNEKGERVSEGNYINNKKTGYWTLFNKDAKIVGGGNYLNGLQTGTWTECQKMWVNYEDLIEKRIEEITSVGEMKDGEKQGIWKSFYANKVLMSEGEYINNAYIGNWSYFYDNGAKEMLLPYNQNGEVDGTETHWDKSGKIIGIKNYIRGGLNGEEKEFVNQKLVKEAKWEKNICVWSKSYYPQTGGLKSEGSVDKNKNIEFLKEYFGNGQPKLQKQKVVSIKEVSGDINFIQIVGTNEWLEWYENNHKKVVSTLDNEGSSASRFYFENGKIMSEFQYKNYLPEGKVEGWFENGNPFFSGSYKEGKITGRWIVWYKNGNKKAEGEFNDGEIISGWKIYNNNGEVVEEIIFSLADFLGNKNEYQNKLINSVKVFYFLITFSKDPDIPQLMEEIKKKDLDSLK